MVTWAEVRRWDPAAIGAVADALNQRCTQLIALNDDVESAATFDGWIGDAAIAASTRGNSLIATLEQRLAEASAVRRGTHEAQLALERITTVVADTDELARVNSWIIGDDGAIVSPPTTGTPPPDVAEHRRKVRLELTDRVEQILRRATDVDADLATILRRATRAEITEHDARTLTQAADSGTAQSGLSIIGPPESGTPGDNHAWWDSLSDTAKTTILRDTPDLVRNLDGIPTADRDSANRAVLQREIGKLEAQAGRTNDPDKRDEINGKLNGLRAIENRLNQPGPGRPQAFLMGLDTSGDGKAVVASGNPDTARNVATYVPGTGVDLSKIEGDVNRADKMWQAATASGSPSTAVVTWIGYDAPDGLSDAASESYADNGKGALGGFQDGLRASHEGAPSHNTVLGHSYGTTVVGHAARDGGLNADDVVFVASPGVGVPNADGLHLDGVDQAAVGRHVHSTVAEHDMIHITNARNPLDPFMHDIALGPDPAAPQFGGLLFESAPGTAGPWYTGGLSGEAHSQYWEDNNPSLDHFGQIIAGKPA